MAPGLLWPMHVEASILGSPLHAIWRVQKIWAWRCAVRCGARRARGIESECLHDGKRLPGTAGSRS
eukprot:360877-Chlamydomonas_euryale.AAC.4